MLILIFVNLNYFKIILFTLQMKLIFIMVYYYQYNNILNSFINLIDDFMHQNKIFLKNKVLYKKTY